MYKKRRGLMRICALASAVLAVGTFSACGGGNADAAKEASTASSIAGMAEKVAPSITARIEFLLDDAQQHPGSVSEQQQDILRRALDHDGVIPRGDYDAAWSRYQDCMAAKGYAKPVTGVFTDGLRSNVMHPYMEGWTKAQQSKFFEDDNSCKQLEYLYVDEIYRANLGNPALLRLVCKDVFELAAVDEASLDVAGGVGEAHGVAAQGLEPAVDGFGGSVA